MLDVSAGRLTAVAGALLLRAIVVIDGQPTSPDVKWGDIVDHTLEVTREGYRFKLRDYSGPEARIVDVRFRGTLPDSVCEGQDASVEGHFEGELFIATEVHGPVCYKGNPCRPYACLPDLERPIECRRSFKFE